jgi:hypothetical protein
MRSDNSFRVSQARAAGTRQPMGDPLLEPDDPPGAQGEDERLQEDVADLPPEADRDADDAAGIGGAEHSA